MILGQHIKSMNLIEKITNEYKNYATFLWKELTHYHWNNYFLWLILISVFVFLLELIFPWRKDQPKIRKDFWLDFFYMFFNIFLFQLIIFRVAATLSFDGVVLLLKSLNLEFLIADRVGGLPLWSQLLILFIVRDFTHWNVHRLLHRVPFLWNFHKVHHSVKQMGFAAHLRFHWMESVVYNTIQFLPLALLGFTLDNFIIVYVITILIGHLNHANFYLPLGPFKYILNNPQMHIWHHSRKIPDGFKYGVNYGLSLSLWDYIFRSASIPSNGRDVELGFEGDENFPRSFSGQIVYGFGKGSGEP